MVQPPLLFSGTSNRQLAEEIAKKMQTRVGNALVDRFKNEEVRIEIRENVRGAEVFVVQSLCRSLHGANVNDAIMELLLIIDALRRASANRITAVIPYYGYAKQDKKTKGREPISAKLVANMIERAGAERIVTLDLHAAQIQGFFDVPVDNLMAAPTLCNHLKNLGLQGDKIVVVSPDAGGVPRAELFAKRLKSNLAVIIKRRPEPDVSEVTHIVGDVERKIAVVVDDMISTGGTLVKAAEALRKKGATDVYTLATHGIFAGDAIKQFENSDIKKVIVTNTIPRATESPKVEHLTIAQILADAIKRITMNRSVSELFNAEEPSPEPPGEPPPAPAAAALELPVPAPV
ncbi:MAG: ribose-phosphate pyrophosphokinase [Candidatus Eremiobacteraeota bacterium]|nr:ribose-phosphate pyrophosphokinase [Candidatus Eremiobacteraeota bacterium]MBV8367981.1 ribose-phosphate pyrophosphokinase [Candidatus Eremiobacteraeota bacterium]